MLPILTILLAVIFARTAKTKGYPQRQIWLYPLIIGGVFTIMSLVMSFLAPMIFPSANPDMKTAYPALSETVATIFYFILIAKAWKQLKALPQRKSSNSR
jgi:Kef-type K+ transport system membrane component KefB